MYTTLCRISKCVRLQGKHASSYAQVITPDLAEDVRAKIGQVFGVLHAETDAKTGDALVAHLEDALGRVSMEVMTRGAGLPRDAQIELVLTKLNSSLDSVFGEYGLPVDRSSVRSVLVFLQGSTLSASFWGDASAQLIRLGETPKVFDIGAARSLGSASSPNYTEVISGATTSRDRLVLSTSNLLNSIDRDMVLKTLTNHRSDDAAVMLGDFFGSANEGPLALIVAGEPAYSNTPGFTTSHSSVEGLLNTTSKTREILSPPLLKPFTSKINSTVSKAFTSIGKTANSLIAMAKPTAQEQNSHQEESTNTEEPAMLSGAISLREPEDQPMISEAASTLRNSATTVAGRSLSFLKSFADADTRKSLLSNLPRFGPHIGANILTAFNTSSRRNKVIIAGVMTAIIAFNGGMMGVLAKQRSEKKVADYENAILTVQQKIDAAESSLIYNDYSRAKTLLDEASVLAVALPNKSVEEQEARAKLEASIAEERQAMRRESSLPEPTFFGVLPEAATGTFASLTFRNGVLFAATTGGELYTTSLKDKTTVKLGDSIGVAPQFLLAVNSTTLAYGGTDGNIRLINDKGAVTSTTTLDGISDLTITDAVFYGTAVYVLDAPHNRIVKYPVATKGFGKAQLSVKDGTDLSKGTSIAIDGSILVLDASGNVIKLNSGSRDQFGVQDADPTPQNAGILTVGSSTDALYFIDGDRLLSYSKSTGRFLGQYLSPSLAGAKDVYLDEKTKTLYVARDRDIAIFTLP